MQAESSSHFGYDYSSSVEPTPRATPRATPRSGRKVSTTGYLPPRESQSSQKHMERLQSARQYGSYRPTSSSSSAAAPAASSGGLSFRQSLAAEGSCSNLKEQVSRLTSAASSSSARVSASHGGIPSSRCVRCAVDCASLGANIYLSLRELRVQQRTHHYNTCALTCFAAPPQIICCHELYKQHASNFVRTEVILWQLTRLLLLRCAWPCCCHLQEQRQG